MLLHWLGSTPSTSHTACGTCSRMASSSRKIRNREDSQPSRQATGSTLGTSHTACGTCIALQAAATKNQAVRQLCSASRRILPTGFNHNYLHTFAPKMHQKQHRTHLSMLPSAISSWMYSLNSLPLGQLPSAGRRQCCDKYFELVRAPARKGARSASPFVRAGGGVQRGAP
jgi:hypothetical protein